MAGIRQHRRRRYSSLATVLYMVILVLGARAVVAQMPSENPLSGDGCPIIPCYWPSCDQCDTNCYTCSDIESTCGYTCDDAVQKLEGDCGEICIPFTPTPTPTSTPTPIPTNTPTPTATPTNTPIPSGLCRTDGNHTRMSVDGYLEHYYDGLKPGRWREASELTGLSWPNGGNRKRYGTGTSYLDWNLCPKIGFNERGHSLTRTVQFVNPPEDGSYTLRVHRIRKRSESYGVNIRYWFNGSQVNFTSGASRSGGNWRVDFRAHRDYILQCTYTQANGVPWSCSWSSATVSSIDCNRWHCGRVGYCQEIQTR